MERPRRRGPEPQIAVVVRRDRHLFLEPVDDLDAVVEPVRLVELFGRRGVLESPRAVRPHVHLADRTDDAGHQDFLDRAPRRRRVALVAHLRRQLRVLRRGLPNEPGFPDVVGERLLAVDVLAVRQRQVGRERVRVLGRRDHDGVEGVRLVEHAPEVVELLRLREPLGRGVHRVLVHVAEDDDVLVRMRSRRCAVPRLGRGRPGAMVSSPRLARARPPQAMNAMFSLSLRFRPRSSAGAPANAPAAARVADELATRDPTLAFTHGVSLQTSRSIAPGTADVCVSACRVWPS